jgi:hypothetical protein
MFTSKPMKMSVLTAAFQELTACERRDADPDLAIEEWLEFSREMKGQVIDARGKARTPGTWIGGTAPLPRWRGSRPRAPTVSTSPSWRRPIICTIPWPKRFSSAAIAVVCDKPLAHSVDDARALCALVASSGELFALTHAHTGYPAVREARERVRQGHLGEIRKVLSWSTSRTG